MKNPPYLKSGDTIGIVACARKIKREELGPAVALFRSWGLNIQFGQHLFGEQNQFSGSDEQRAEDLQNMLNDSEIKAIISARGGYGTMRIVDMIDWSGLNNNPKWICGFSDITVLHSHVHSNIGLKTLHSPMPSTIANSTTEALSSFRSALFGESLHYQFSASLENETLNRSGESLACVIGGNLSLLYALNGSASDIDTRGKILFIEDLDEYLYHIDRMIVSLKRSGKLSELKGLVVGGMSDMKDNAIPFGKTAAQIIAEAVSEYYYPVCFDFPSGHINDNRAVVLGAAFKLEVQGANASLKLLN